MGNLRQLVVQIVIGTMALGGTACLCPAAAGDHVTPAAADAHRHHDSGSVSGTASEADCGHEDCEAGCERGSAVASKGTGGTAAKPASQLDHTGILPPEVPALAPIPGVVIASDFSRLPVPLRQETPVQRCDRLLD